MKKVVITIGIAALIASGCGRATKKQDNVNNPETELALENKDESVNDENFGNKENSLYGKVFYYKMPDGKLIGIPELSGFKLYIHTSIIGDYGLMVASDESKNIALIFEETTYINNDDIKRKVLDIIHIGKLKDNEQLSELCYKEDEEENDDKVIAIYTDNDWEKEIFDKIVKAWRLNMSTGKFESIIDLKGIKCWNEGYGV